MRYVMNYCLLSVLYMMGLIPQQVFAEEAAPSSLAAADADIPLDLSGVVNMSFTDEIAGDGIGGWSDQGADNDFRQFPVTASSFGGVSFRIVDPAKNAKRSVITFRHEAFMNGPERTNIVVPDVSAQYLYILHTTCWNDGKTGKDIGTILVHWADGSMAEQVIKSGREATDWWNPDSVENGALVVTQENQLSVVGVFLSRFKLADKPAAIRSIEFVTAKSCVWIVIGATLSTRDVPLPATPVCRIEESDDWKPANFTTGFVEPGSVLDMSALVEQGPAGRLGPVITRPDGRFAFRDRPEQPVRFFGNSISYEALPYNKDQSKRHRAIEEFVDLTVLQGYNMLRPHFLDHILTTRSEQDLEFDPEALDSFDYLVHCCKQRGVYLYFDAMTSWRGYKKGYGWDQAAQDVDFKTRIYVEDEVRAHWKEGVAKLMTRKNPYTGSTLAEDPVVAVVLCYNEQNLNVWRKRKGFPAGFAERWRAWLKDKYKTEDALSRAWMLPSGVSQLPQGTTFDTLPAFDYAQIMEIYQGGHERARDLARFMIDLHRELYSWYENTLREMGYAGIVTQYDWLPIFQDNIIRATIPAISMHNYHAHPSNFINRNSVCDQSSSLRNGGNYFTSMAMTRYGGRPFMITEYGHVFWNRYRYEEGALIGAYAALQGYDCLYGHGSPVMNWQPKVIKPFSIACDPIARASQIVTGYAFLRADVRQSPAYVDISLDPEEIIREGKAYNTIGAHQSRLALLTGVGISVSNGPSATPPMPANVTLPVFGMSRIKVEQFFAEVQEESHATREWRQTVERLRKSGILPEGNRTDIDQGVYESDTGEILLETRKHRLQVKTPTLESVCLDPAEDASAVTLSALAVFSTNVPASVSAIAIDGQPLPNSGRILLVYQTDALNSGMTFSAENRRRLLKPGTLPVLMRCGKLEVGLAVEGGQWKAWAVGMDGTRAQELSLRVENGQLCLSIDTAALEGGPTPFFELARVAK